MELKQCYNCGHGGWTKLELKNGLCPSCREDEIDDDAYLPEWTLT